MTSTLTLASRLAALDDETLTALISARLPLRGRIEDFFDLAEALLEGPALQHTLSALDRPTLQILAALVLDETVDVTDVATAARLRALSERALVEAQADGSFAIYDAVRERLALWPHEGLPSAHALLQDAPPTALAPVPDAEPERIDRYASEKAFQSVSAFAELLGELDREPARELQKGGLSLPDGRRLAAVMVVEAEVVPVAMWLAELAGLVAREGSNWLTTEGAEPWLALSTHDRWRTLAATWSGAMSAGIRSLLAGRTHAAWGEALHEVLSWYYPASGDALARQVERFEAGAELLGITAHQLPSTPGGILLTDGPEAAADAMATLLPGEVDRVYVQQDLSIVSPGPLVPALDGRLRRLAEVESRALASTYRVTATSLERAIGAGETVDSIRAFLTQVSLTGIPQPLDYLIEETGKRYGLVRVRDNGADARLRTSITSPDRDLLDAIAVDQTFAALGLTRLPDGALGSRFTVEIVYWALADARYPVAAEDAHGRIIGVKKRHAPPTDTIPVVDRAGLLVAALRQASAAEAAQSPEAWLSRQLETAVRGRVPLVVTVGMPDGSEIEFLLEPTGVGGGRLRGRDRRADIERTLPLKSIKGVRTP